MNREERQQAISVLRRIPEDNWERFLEYEGSELGRKLRLIRGALKAVDSQSRGRPRRPVEELVDLCGDRLMSDDDVGPWIREHLVRRLAPRKWRVLRDSYRELAGARAARLPGQCTQAGSGSRRISGYWHQGSRWAHRFCEVVGLPQTLASLQPSSLPADEDVAPVVALPPLHRFQLDVYRQLRRLLSNGLGKAAILSLPTGAGKTRTAVEAICDHLVHDRDARYRRNIVLWLAHREELQRQAWDSFRQVWQIPPVQRNGTPGPRRVIPMRIARLWGGRDPETLEIGPEPLILIAGVQQLASWVRNRPDFVEGFPVRRLACVVIDEAHTTINDEHRHVLTALSLRQHRSWKLPALAPPVIGLTATPFRTGDRQSAVLRSYFQRRLLAPASLGSNPVRALQKQRFLARVEASRLRVVGTPPLTPRELKHIETFGEVPEQYLAKLGREQMRNARIIKRLSTLPKRCRVIVFACSIEHAEILAVMLNQVAGSGCAAALSTLTPRAERAELVDRFRTGRGLRFLCNVGVLAMGFDAPHADVVCVTRPTVSALRYEQMVGRGLRGPKNGGTERCLVLDVQDVGLPIDVQSYGRVLEEWLG